MGDPVARIQSIHTLERGIIPHRGPDGHRYYTLGQVYDKFIAKKETDIDSHVPTALVVRRKSGVDIKVALAAMNMPLEVGDVVTTGPYGLVTIEFFIGGRVSVNKDTSVEIVNERAVADQNVSMKRWFLKNAALWIKADAATLKQPIEIQTNGGTIGIKG